MTAVALDTRDVALDLYALLRDLDPSRWQATIVATARTRLASIEQRAARIVEAAQPSALRARLEEVLRIVRAYALSLGLDLTGDRLKGQWMALRIELQTAYEALAASLRQWDVHVPSLRPTNHTRNAFHLLSAMLVIGLVEGLLHTPRAMQVVAFGAAGLGWTLEGTRRLSTGWNGVLMRLFGPVAHPHETHRVNSATWYVTALAALSMTGSTLVGVVAVAVLGAADPAAAFIGRRWGRTALWNGRTLEGSAAFVVAGFVAAFAVITAFHDVGAGPAAVLALVAALAGAVAEVATRRVDDNLAIPLAAGAATAVALLAI